MTTTSIEGHHLCGSCIQWVGTAYDGETRPYRRFMTTEGREVIVCADKDACKRRWQRAKDADRVAAAEARTWFPEPADEDEEDL